MIDYDLINDINISPTVYHRIYCRKYLTLSIRHRVTKTSALEFDINIIHNDESMDTKEQRRPLCRCVVSCQLHAYVYVTF